MKDLLLLRHAKSSWDDPSLKDFDRPLSKRGMKDTYLMAKVFYDTMPLPEIIYCSPSKRTQSTLERLCEVPPHLYRKVPVEYVPGLYETTVSYLVKFLESRDDAYHTLLIVGHNSSLSDLVAFLCNENTFHLPTCAMVHIELTVDRWQHVASGTGILKRYEYPKKYK